MRSAKSAVKMDSCASRSGGVLEDLQAKGMGEGGVWLRRLVIEVMMKVGGGGWSAACGTHIEKTVLGEGVCRGASASRYVRQLRAAGGAARPSHRISVIEVIALFLSFTLQILYSRCSAACCQWPATVSARPLLKSSAPIFEILCAHFSRGRVQLANQTLHASPKSAFTFN